MYPRLCPAAIRCKHRVSSGTLVHPCTCLAANGHKLGAHNSPYQQFVLAVKFYIFYKLKCGGSTGLTFGCYGGFFFFSPPTHPPFMLQKPALARFLLLNVCCYVHKACQFCTSLLKQ